MRSLSSVDIKRSPAHQSPGFREMPSRSSLPVNERPIFRPAPLECSTRQDICPAIVIDVLAERGESRVIDDGTLFSREMVKLAGEADK